MSKIKNWFKENKKTALILVAIFMAGVFLRTYEFHDWLRFSRDQVRDASLISNALENKDHLPLLGPNAGITKFRLGPIYYYFSYASEKIFGDYPDKMAYPSVFFSILSIPLLFFFLREFFDSPPHQFENKQNNFKGKINWCGGNKISLAMTAIASVSYFLVINSRFSSNPNLIPFFVLLYLFALLKMLNNQGKFNLKWSILLGIGIGVGIQLHTTLLIVMPLLSLCIFIYLLKNKTAGIWKNLFIVLSVVLILNASQIISEIDLHGQNTRYFLKGFRNSSNKHLIRNTFQISACQIQVNTHIISSFGNDDPCNAIFYTPQGQSTDKFLYYLGMTFVVLFSLIGYFLLILRFIKEKIPEKRNFLGLVILFNLISFIILIPIAPIIFVGYFINLFMVPLVLLGLMIETIEKKYQKTGIYITTLAIVLLIASSLVRDGFMANNYIKGLENNSKNATLSEVESIAQYILSNSKKDSKQYLTGQNGLAERFFRSINYFTNNFGVETALLKPGDEAKIRQGDSLYYLKENISGEAAVNQMIYGYEVILVKKLSGLTILLLKNN